MSERPTGSDNTVEADISHPLSEREKQAFDQMLRQAQERFIRMQRLSMEVLSEHPVLVVDMTNGFGTFGQHNWARLQRLNPDRLQQAIQIETGCTSGLPDLEQHGTQRATYAYKLGIPPQQINVWNPYNTAQPAPGPIERYPLIILSGSPAFIKDGTKQDQAMSDNVRRLLGIVGQRGIPVAAVCYGMQLICDSFGATVDWIQPENQSYCVTGPQIMHPTQTGASDPLHANNPSVAIAYHQQGVHIHSGTNQALRVLSTYPQSDIVTTATIREDHGIWALLSQLHTEVGIPTIHIGETASGKGEEQTGALLEQAEHVARFGERFFVHALRLVRNKPIQEGKK